MYKFLSLLLLLLLVGFVTAVEDLTIVDSNINKVHQQGDHVHFTLVIKNIQPQVRDLVIETDLQPYGDFALWNITHPGFLMLPDEQKQYQTQSVKFGINHSINEHPVIQITGKVPHITRVTVSDGVVIATRDRTTGYFHYRINSQDRDGFTVGMPLTEFFEIHIPEEKVFLARLEGVQDPTLKAIIFDLYEKGLRNEAYQVLDYSESKQPGISLPLFIIVIIVLGGITAFIGYRIGLNRGYQAGINEHEYDKRR